MLTQILLWSWMQWVHKVKYCLNAEHVLCQNSDMTSNTFCKSYKLDSFFSSGTTKSSKEVSTENECEQKYRGKSASFAHCSQPFHALTHTFWNVVESLVTLHCTPSATHTSNVKGFFYIITFTVYRRRFHWIFSAASNRYVIYYYHFPGISWVPNASLLIYSAHLDASYFMLTNNGIFLAITNGYGLLFCYLAIRIISSVDLIGLV